MNADGCLKFRNSTKMTDNVQNHLAVDIKMIHNLQKQVFFGGRMITSNANSRVKQIIQWQTKAKERRKDGVFLVEGMKLFEEAPQNQIKEVYISKSMAEKLSLEQDIGELQKNSDAKYDAKKEPDNETHYNRKKLIQTGFEIVADDIFLKMSDTQTPQGILSVLYRKEHTLEEIIDQKDPLIMILENLQDPGNLGTIMRTGEGAGVTGVIMSSQTVDIYNPKTIRATMGSIYRVPFVYVEDLSEVLKLLSKKGIHSYAAHLKGKDYYLDQQFKDPTAFLIGNEGNGLSKEIADQADKYIKIPMEGKVESLNAAVAAALLMYEAHRQRGL